MVKTTHNKRMQSDLARLASRACSAADARRYKEIMKKYQLKLRGENFLSKNENSSKEILGFYTTRWIEANNPKEAEYIAIDLIKNDKDLKNITLNITLNEHSDPPKIYLEEVYEVDNFDSCGKGYTFYPDKVNK